MGTQKSQSAMVDQALDRLGRYGPEFSGGLSNHGPMVVEALHHLGAADAIDGWVDNYARHLEPAPVASSRFLQRGDLLAVADWEAYFHGELDRRSWIEVVRESSEHLLAGMAGAAGHGLLRVAHIIRLIQAVDTQSRRAELARALAYAAAAHVELPGDPRPSGELMAGPALDALPSPPADSARFITDRFKAFHHLAGFTEGVDALEPAALDVGAFTCAVASRVATHRVNRIVYTHAITIPSALRIILPLLDPPQQIDALRFGWRTVAALVAGWPPERLRDRPGVLVEPAQLIERALASGDEHHIKLTAAVLDELEATGDDVVLRAADVLI